MAKTFKEWFDGLSDATRLEFVSCYGKNWIDFDAPDYYRQPVYDTSSMTVQDFLYKNDNLSLKTNTLIVAVKNLIENNKYNEAFELVKTYMDERELNSRDVYHLAAYFCNAEFRALIKREINSHATWRREPFERLPLQTDFSHLDIHEMNCDQDFNNCYLEIFGKDAIKEVWLSSDTYINPYSYCKPTTEVGKQLTEIFDELFFGENGWSQEQKNHILNRVRCYKEDVEAFMRLIVAVDKKYLKNIYNVISSNTALATELSQQLKPDSELTGNETREQRYRYPKELRRLFQICGCCIRGTLPKTRISKIGDIANIVKLYNFNFSNIFDALYPETIEEVETIPAE